MGLQLNSFVNHFKNQGIRSSIMWRMEASCGIAEVDRVLNLLDIYIDGWTAPKRSINYGDVKFRAYPTKVPLSVQNEQEHTVNVITDISGAARNAFLIWMNSVIDADFSAGSYFAGNKRYPTTSNFRLHLLSDDMDTIVQTILITGVNIVDVGELKMSNKDASVCEFPVKFNSLWWNYEGGESSNILTTGA